MDEWRGAAILEAKNCAALGGDTTEWYRYLLGKALVFNFEGDYAGAQKALLLRSPRLSVRVYVTDIASWPAFNAI